MLRSVFKSFYGSKARGFGIDNGQGGVVAYKHRPIFKSVLFVNKGSGQYIQLG